MKTCVFVMLFLAADVTMAQDRVESDSAEAFDRLMERTLEDDEEDPTQVLDEIILQQENPLDLNKASEREIAQIPGISNLVAYRIISARREAPFANVSDLLRIEGITPDLFAAMKPFVVAGRDANRGVPISVHSRSRIQSDLERRRGYIDGTYDGSAQRLYQRVLIKGAIAGFPLEAALMAEKDPGELPADRFIGGYCSATLPSSSNVLVGDFVVESGAGLVLGRRSDLMNRHEPPRLLSEKARGHKSVVESEFFRGIAVGINAFPVGMTFFYSSRKREATVNLDGSLSGLSGTGLFRTDSERERRSAASERVFGGILSFEPGPGLSLSLKAVRSQFNRRLDLAGGFRGPVVSSIGVSMAFAGNGMGIWGEFAGEENGARAGAAQVEWDFGARGSWKLSARIFEDGFLRLYGGKRVPRDERAFQCSGIFHAAHWLSVQMQWSLVAFPHGKEAGSFSMRDQRFDGRAMMKIFRFVRMETGYRRTETEGDGRAIDERGREVVRGYATTTSSIFFKVSYGNPGSFRWQSKVTAVVLTGGLRESGLALTQELRCTAWPAIQWGVSATVYGTDSYQSRVFVYNPDVPGTVLSRPLFGSGSQFAVNARALISAGVELSASYSADVRDGTEHWSSGPDEVTGDTLSRFSVQLDIRWNRE